MFSHTLEAKVQLLSCSKIVHVKSVNSICAGFIDGQKSLKWDLSFYDTEKLVISQSSTLDIIYFNKNLMGLR